MIMIISVTSVNVPVSDLELDPFTHRWKLESDTQLLIPFGMVTAVHDLWLYLSESYNLYIKIALLADLLIVSKNHIQW